MHDKSFRTIPLHDDKIGPASKFSMKEQSPYHPEIFAYIGILWGILFIGFILDVYFGVNFVVHMIVFGLVIFIWVFIMGAVGYIFYSWKGLKTNATDLHYDHDQ
jgi:hypothetical protein